jgi:hypothetical protein
VARWQAVSPATPAGVPLAAYRANRADVLLTCLDCFWRLTIDREVVITRLQARGVGGEDTGIKAVAEFVTRRCPRCGGLRFDTCPAFP